MYSEIIANIRTKEDAWALEQEIDILLNKLYSAKADEFSHALEHDVRSNVALIIKSSIEKARIDRDKYLQGLKNELKKLKEIQLTLAFEPTDATLEKIFLWVRENVGKGIILDINYSKTISGGAVIIHKGKYRDYSLKKLIRNDLDNNKQKVETMFSK
jgi:F0F1-type ATP synthase delta subunit